MNDALTKLKGGSLSGVYLTDGIVRKECRMDVHKEYGYRRWQSQLKRLQRYNQMFPGLFPNVLDYGMKGDVAYYDMTHVKGMTAYEYLTEEKDRSRIDWFWRKLQDAMSRMHDIVLPSGVDAVKLYFREEVQQKIRDAQDNVRFHSALRSKRLVFAGEDVPSFLYVMDEFGTLLESCYNETQETYSHGNITLENVMYNPSDGKITFIDPYEENVIDSYLCDYSQILQSCNSNYELYNAKGWDAMPSEGMLYFREIFMGHLRQYHPAQLNAIHLFEISQFIRMLPFKMHFDEGRMWDFYGYASKLFNDFRIDWESR